MQTIHHSYSPAWMMRSFTNLLNILGFVYPLFLFFTIFSTRSTHLPPMTLGQIIYFFLLGILTGLVLIIAGNFMTEIVSDENGLHVNFLWKHLFMPYKDIIEIRSYSSFPFIKRKSMKIIRTRSLTPFHRLYGLLYSFSFSPSIVYNKGISEFDELTRRIEKSLRKKQKKVRQTFSG